MTAHPYIASIDSALLRKALQGSSGGSFLEIGAGNGGNMAEASKGFRLVVGTDLARPTMTDWRREGVEFVLADGASCVRDAVFDLVAFNPPYIPGEVEDRAVDGGEDLEVPKKFLRDALRAVKGGGEVVFLLNGEARLDEFRTLCTTAGFGMSPLISERTFYEELTVYSARAGPHGTPSV